MTLASRAGHTAAARALRPTAISLLLAPLLLGGLLSVPPPVHATPPAAPAPASRTYQIPAGPLATALSQYGRDSGILLSFLPSMTQGRHSPGLQGSYTEAAGLEALLAGSGLRAVAQGERRYLLEVVPPPRASQLLEAVTVAAPATADSPPPVFAGGQVARGGRTGILGNLDFMETPYSQVSYTSELMQDQQARSITDVIQNDPSVRLTDAAGVGMEQSLLIRGFSQNGTATYFNGLYGVLPPYLVSTEIADRVEVLKGPNATLFGMTPFGGLGGALNVVPKRAEATPLTRLGVQAQASGQAGLSLDLGRRVGAQQALGVRLNAAYRDGNAAIDDQQRRVALLALGLDHQGERSRLSLDVVHQRNRTTNPRPALVFAHAALPSAPDAKTNYLTGGMVDYRDTGVVARAEYDLTSQITAYAAAGQSRGSYSLISPALVGTVATDGSFQARLRGSWMDLRRTGLDAGLRARFSTGAIRHQATLSVNQVRYTTWISNYTTGPTLDARLDEQVASHLTRQPKDLARTSANVMTSVTLADTLALLDERLRLTLGVRHQRVDSKTFQRDGALSGPAYDEDALTPTLGVLFQPLADGSLALYANYIEGLSQGSRVTDTEASNYGMVFPPYKTRQYEAGIKWDMGELATTLSAFQIAQPSLLKTTAADGSIVYGEDGQQRNRGIEWNVFGQITPAWRVMGGLAYTQAELTRTAGGANDGHRAPGVARWQGSLSLDWRVPGPLDVALNGRAIYTGPTYLNATNTQQIGSWVRYDLGARWRTQWQGRELVLRATVENLLDRHHWIANGSGGAGLNAPRTVLLSATMDF